MRELPLNALRAFALVVERGGVRAAARELGVAHSAVSRHLAELEDWLGFPLSEPGAARAWQPTPQAAALAVKVLEGLRMVDAATAAAREDRSPFSVIVSAAPSVAIRWLLPRLPAFERAHPRLEVSIRVNQQVEELVAGRDDLAIRMGSGPWPGLVCEPLMDDLLYPVMGPQLWRESGQPTDLAALAALRLLHDRDPATGWALWRSRFGPPGLQISRGPRLASSDLLLRAAQQGQGVALARHRLAADDVEAGLLVRPFGEHAIPIKDAYWLLRPPGTPRAAVAALWRWLKERASAS